MAAPYNPPVKNENFLIGIGVQDIDDSANLRVNPTIAAGDWQVSKDFGAFANLTTLPTVSPAGSQQIKITLSATEMNADVVTLRGVDLTTIKEYADYMLAIPTTA